MGNSTNRTVWECSCLELRQWRRGKLQAPSSNIQRIFNHQTSRAAFGSLMETVIHLIRRQMTLGTYRIGAWNLMFLWMLELGAWSFLTRLVFYAFVVRCSAWLTRIVCC